MGNEGKTVLISSDHNGVAVREALSLHMLKRGIVCADLGPGKPGPIDYVDCANQVGNAVGLRPDCLRGVLVCGTGIGMSIVANRYPRVRASLVTDIESALKTREHNDSNVLVLGAWKNEAREHVEIFDAWWDGAFGEGRHVPRVESIDGSPSKLVLVPGVFDWLKSEHVDLLDFAMRMGKVIIALNTDDSARRIKGGRLDNAYERRARVLKAFPYSREVIPNPHDDVGWLVEQLGVDYVVKGSNYSEQQIRERDKVPDSVKVVLFPYQHTRGID